MKEILNKIRSFWKSLVWDDTSNKIGSKRFMSIISFFCALLLIFGNHYFDFSLDYVALGSLITMAGYTSYLGKEEKRDKLINK